MDKPTNQEILTDDQCIEFRRLPGSFNDMVRAVYEAGAQSSSRDDADCLTVAYMSGFEKGKKARLLSSERDAQELSEYRRLTDPAVLHVNLLRGLPARLSRNQLLHIAGDGALESDRDAKRYRFIRDHAFGKIGGLALLPPDEMDAATDKAMSAAIAQWERGHG